MTSTTLVLLITVGAALIALWTDVRWPALAPERPGLRVLHLVLALAAAQYVAPALMAALLPDGRSATMETIALFAFVLPSLVYTFLSGIWVLKLLQRALQPY
jgi:amino acid transporter